PLGVQDRIPAVMVDRAGQGRVRRAQQLGRLVRRRGGGHFRLWIFEGGPPAGGGREVRGGGRGGPAFFAGFNRPLPQRRVPGDLRADHEEGRIYLVLAQRTQHLRSPRRVGTVVEGERDRAARHRVRLRLAVLRVEHGPALADRGRHRVAVGVRCFQPV